jgi:hypothetical protein
MNKKSTFIKFAEGVFVPVLLVTMTVLNAKQVKYRMTYGIPASITTPDSVRTSPGTLRFFDGFPDAETTRNGPLAIELTANVLGMIHDFWFRFVGDIGNRALIKLGLTRHGGRVSLS